MPKHTAPAATSIETIMVGSRKVWVAVDSEGYNLTSFRTAKEAREWQHRMERDRLASLASVEALNANRAAAVRAYLVKRAARVDHETAQLGLFA